MIHDVAICGAGPAGSYAAYLLARQGLDVALIDKAVFPREKPCGGALSRKALELVDFDLQPVVQRRVTGAWLACGGRAVRHDANGVVAAMTERVELDAFLVERARAAGARFLPGTALQRVTAGADDVSIATSAGELRARYLLGADGVASAVRARVFGRDAIQYAPAVEALVYAPPDVVARFADRVLLEVGGMPQGYGWVFGKRDHLNVGVFSVRGASGIRAHLAAFRARYPALGRYARTRELGHPIPVRHATAVEHGRVWLLGDAAGLVESVLGEGIYFALKSAVLAARAFATARGAPRVGEYAALVRCELEPELAAARRLARACYARPGITFEHIARNAHASRLFLGLVTGEVGYRECFVRALAEMPAWMVARREPVVPVGAI
ncbi:MAG: geranylgeranyl reductase family protein [Bacteroidota bacterium]